MIERKIKKDFRRVTLGILTVLVIVAVSTILGLSIKNVIPLLRTGSEQKDMIIKPVSELTTKENLNKFLSDKNFILESLAESSASGIIIGEIRDGPKVYFAKNKDAKWQITSLELILRKLSIDNKKPVLIDLRFEQPIVKF